MQHIWNDNNTCERCGLVKVRKNKKILISNKYSATYTQHYTVYYSGNVIALYIMPQCYNPKQIKLDL